MHPFRSIRRVALGAALAGAAIGAVPALASAAATTCSYDPANGGRVTVNDNSAGLPLRISVEGTVIGVDDGGGPSLCTGGGTFALTTNTNLINVRGTFASASDSLIVDQSQGQLGPGTTPEADGSSEVEVAFQNTGGPRGNVHVIGTAQPDVVEVLGKLGTVNLGNDNDNDIVVVGGTASVDVEGRGGDDTLTGHGSVTGTNAGATNVKLRLSGGDGHDAVFGGMAPNDVLQGGNDGDVLISADNANADVVNGGFGDDFASVDSGEVAINSLEHITFVGPVGQVRLTPGVLKAEAGMISRLKVAWKHPQSWRELRELTVSLYDGKEAVGMINVRPAGGRVSSTGAVDLLRSRCKVAVHGKWVTAKLWMGLPKALAGKNLRVAVQATDTHGRKQTERAAGTIRVR
jgi:hypothetical protein